MNDCYFKYLDFSTESFDMERIVLDSLNKFNNKTYKLEDNIENLEKAIIDYTIFKLIVWKKEIPNDKDLNTMFTEIDSYIPEKDKEGFFNQCILTILRILKKYNKQEKIEWIKAELDTNAVLFKNNNIFKLLITNENLKPHKMPEALIEETKRLVLKKGSTEM